MFLRGVRPKTVYFVTLFLALTVASSITHRITAVESAAPSAATDDYGDMPATYGATLFFDDGSRHAVGSLYLGATVDAEEDGRISADSTADPSDDGVSITNDDAWLIGTQRDLNITVTGGTGYLVGWIDWDRNATFDVPTDTVDFGTVSAGAQTVTVTIHDSFDTFSDDPLVARFRLFPISTPQMKSLHGAATNGEVEDYVWEVPTLRYYFPVLYGAASR